MPLALTTTYKKIKAIKKPIRLLQGGQGAGKNMSMALYLLERQDARIITIMTDTYSNLRDGAINDFKFIFEENGLDFSLYFNKSDMDLKWGKSTIQFRHLDNNNPDKGKGARRDIIYINEGNRVKWSAVSHYIARSKEIFVDFNPDFEFWAHTELLPRQDCKRIIVTYKDNEMCPENEVRYIESRKHLIEWYRVYGEGKTGTYSERRIYTFEIVDEIPAHAKQLPRGMDFGSSPDPTTQIDCYLDGIDLYCHEVWTENNLLPEEIKGAEDRICIADRMDIEAIRYARLELPNVPFKHEDKYYTTYRAKTHEAPDANDNLILQKVKEYKARYILADSSGAKEIADLQRRGYNAMGVKKRKGSVQDGINRLRGYNLKITKSSLGLKKGLESWMRKQDKNGKLTSEPDGHEPDQLAAIRYVVLGRELW